jgi:hypothetical protein
MRRFFVTLAGALVFALVGLVGTGSANAATLGSTSVRSAADSIAFVEKTACWRHGWHGWGWYPCGGPVVVAPGPVVAPVVVAPAPVAAPVVVAPGPGPCYGHGWHRVCNGWGHCWRACN